MTGKVLVVVDLQRDFINPRTEHLPARVEELTGTYPRVIATRFVNAPGSLWVTEVGCEKCMRDTPGAELAFTSRAPLIVIDKDGYGVLGAALAPMRRALREAGCRRGAEIDVCGVDTDACVLKTALDLFDLGYRPRILIDACASGNGDEYHRLAAAIIKRQLGSKALVRSGTETDRAGGGSALTPSRGRGASSPRI
jgi:nicotinamidase-related amidase